MNNIVINDLEAGLELDQQALNELIGGRRYYRRRCFRRYYKRYKKCYKHYHKYCKHFYKYYKRYHKPYGYYC